MTAIRTREVGVVSQIPVVSEDQFTIEARGGWRLRAQPHMEAHSAKDGMNSNLDVLRAFAVLAVFVNHLLITLYKPVSWFGWIGRMGVLLFFVHTALVLMQSMERHGIRAGWIGRFYLRRAFRIYPLAIFCMSGVLLLRMPSAPHSPYVQHSGFDIALNYLLLQNLFNRHSILAPMWSLPYEIQMYMLLPLVFLVLRGRQRWIHLAGLVLVALALARLNYIWPKDIVLFEFFPCFMGGIVAWQLGKVGKQMIPAGWWPIILVAFSTVFLIFYSRNADLKEQWLFCLALGAVLPFVSQLRTSVITVPAEKIAQYSYSIYLLHETFLWIFYVLIPGSFLWRTLGFAVSLPIACVATYHLVEKPMIRLGTRLSPVPPRLVQGPVAKVRTTASGT